MTLPLSFDRGAPAQGLVRGPLCDLPLRALLACLAATFLACAGSDAPTPLASAEAKVIGQCTRDELVLRDPEPRSCALDTTCGCGSFCDPVDHVCKFECMVPPADAQESCAAGTQCDDTGRCVGPSTQPPPHAPTLAALPPALEVAPSGGGASQLTVRLSLYDLSTSDPSFVHAQTTEVRVAAGEGMEVSCNPGTFATSCELTSWTFAWDGARHVANRPVWVRSLPGNALAQGQVLLHVDELGAQVVVPTSSSAPDALDGVYVGLATSDSIATGVPVTVRARGDLLLVRDASRTIAPDGALLLDYLASPSAVATPRRMAWLRPTEATPPSGGLIAEVAASGAATFDGNAGSLSAGFTIGLPGLPLAPWSLQLQRSASFAAECAVAADCAAGSQCVAELGACVPTSVWSPLVEPLANNFEDPRSLSWWNATVAMLGSGDLPPASHAGAKAAFATTGADLIEALLCSTSETEAAAGRLGVQQLRQGFDPSRAGDLQCVAGAGAGAPTLSPGAVGLSSYRDRQGNAAISSALLGLCLQDLARPVTSSFAANYTASVGQCANLARFVPALRLLATSELDKRTTLTGARTRGLLVRLLQQWTQLHGFLASTGLSEREYDDAVAAGPAEARQELLSLLDVLDAGWAALLDKRVAPKLAAAAAWAPTATSAIGDYREAKKPVVYWTFNQGPNPQRDLIRGVNLTPIYATSKPGCQIRSNADAISGDWNCPGLLATLPADAPSIAGNTDLTVTMFASSPTAEFPPYGGGTMFMMETLAAVSYPLATAGQPVLALVHPTADGGTEWVAFDWVYGFWATSFAVVRDTATMTYTLYGLQAANSTGPRIIATQRYYQPVGGKLSINYRNVRLGGGQWPNYAGYAGLIDDFAIFDSALSQREIFRFATARGVAPNHRDVWPADMVLTPFETQELTTPVGASVLEGQVAELAVVARLTTSLAQDALSACTGEDPAARASLDAGVARAGRALRQSEVLEGLVAADVSVRAGQARQELRAKRSAIARALHALYSCADRYGLADHEVPLYFGDVTGETAAFFAASDHLLGLAEGRVAGASNALDAVRSRWDAARQSKLQEQLDAQNRTIRVNEQETRFGEQLKRLCGISELTNQQLVQQVKDGTFSVETCFVAPSPACQHASTAIMDADPACYRGIIGAQLMDIRASYHAQQAAYQTWQAAVGNAEGAERLCVLKEMDLYGCAALNRHELTGVTCPAGHQGTIELVNEFNSYLNDRESEQSWLSAAISVCTVAAAVVTTVATAGAGAAALVAAGGALSVLQPELSNSIEARKRSHQAVLQKRAAEDDLRACWTASDQFQRAIAAAEETSLEAVARMQTATLVYQNALAEAREVLLEAPVAIDREQHRPSLPIAFHYWLPEAMTSYQLQLESARRYAYMALRATEYDVQQTFAGPAPSPTDPSPQPSRAAVVGAWRPTTLTQQLQLLRSATDARRIGNGRPAADHLVLSVASDLFGLDPYTYDVGPDLAANARPVYSSRGEYLGEGVRFSLIPKDAASAPVWRCAERLWRANVGRAGGVVGSLRVKLLKRTLFGSRACASDQLQVATLRPERNLLVAGGEVGTYQAQPNHTVADIDTVDLNILGNVDGFRYADDFVNGSSTELAGQGLFGDYVLLFQAPSFATGFQLANVQELYLRFDFLSVDNTPAIPALRGEPPAPEQAKPEAKPAAKLKAKPAPTHALRPTLTIDRARTPIIVD